MDKLRSGLLGLGYGRGEVDDLLVEIRKRRDTDSLSPFQQRMLFITMQEMLDFSRAANYRKRHAK
ncbi:MAG: hypothetical protein M0Z41_19685 [Peptococcaceae bacterium]|jgi:hypothetical protein|nr:hypothetical protein [Peptococcaceae bacterium]